MTNFKTKLCSVYFVCLKACRSTQLEENNLINVFCLIIFSARNFCRYKKCNCDSSSQAFSTHKASKPQKMSKLAIFAIILALATPSANARVASRHLEDKIEAKATIECDPGQHECVDACCHSFELCCRGTHCTSIWGCD